LELNPNTHIFTHSQFTACDEPVRGRRLLEIDDAPEQRSWCFPVNYGIELKLPDITYCAELQELQLTRITYPSEF
jgi:hypothetical protein